MIKYKYLILIIINFILWTLTSYSWDCHFLMTYIALKNMPNITQPTVKAESLKQFVMKEQKGLEKLLADNENWSQQNINLYPLLPATLKFQTDLKDPALAFKKAIRINTNLKIPLFYEVCPGELRHHNNPMQKQEAMLREMINAPWVRIPNPPLETLQSGEYLSPLTIIATAADEPDYGMDINVWQNSASSFGKEYHWGIQPWGNSALELTSQAPFHMAFFYENKLMYILAPELKKDYAEYRIHLYTVLAQFAFASHHFYWGYRFLGWALHYIQDYTQPYHVTVAPNISLARMIWVNLLYKMGYTTPQNKLIQLLTNRHFSLENYEYFVLYHSVMNRQENIFTRALSQDATDKKYPPYSYFYPRQIVAKEANQAAINVDHAIQTTIPSLYIDDPNYLMQETDPNIDLWQVLQSHKINTEILDRQLIRLLKNIGAHSRNFVQFITKK